MGGGVEGLFGGADAFGEGFGPGDFGAGFGGGWGFGFGFGAAGLGKIEGVLGLFCFSGAVLVVGAQPVDDAAGFFFGALGVEGDDALEDEDANYASQLSNGAIQVFLRGP